MKKWKIAVRIAAFLGCAALLLYGLTVFLKDKRVTFDYDTTRKVEGFYAEEKDSLDFVFVITSDDSIVRAFSLASATCDTFIRNIVCHE